MLLAINIVVVVVIVIVVNINTIIFMLFDADIFATRCVTVTVPTIIVVLTSIIIIIIFDITYLSSLAFQITHCKFRILRKLFFS